MKLIAMCVAVAATWSWPVPAAARFERETRQPPQQVVAPANTSTLVGLQWDQPSESDSGVRGPEREVALFVHEVGGAPLDLCRAPDQRVCQFPGPAHGGTAEAIELVRIINRTRCDIRIDLEIDVHTGPGLVNAERVHLTVVSTDLGIAPLGGDDCSDCGDDGQCHGGWGPTPP